MLEDHLKLLLAQRASLSARILNQAELQLMHNVHECRTKRNAGCRTLFRLGMNQGVETGLDFFYTNFQTLMVDKRPLTSQLISHTQHVIETCQLTPYRAGETWGLTLLYDHLDTEKEHIINGMDYGLRTLAHGLPRLIKTMTKIKGSPKEAFQRSKSSQRI